MSQTKLLRDAPPLMPTLTSSKYHIKWTQLADLPAAMYDAHIAVQDRKIYISGGIGDVINLVFVYEIDNNRWDTLPPLNHCYAIPHIIGNKLTLVGGRPFTNKVSTFDQTKQSWVSYYPNLLSARHQPGIITHMEYVIVAGGLSSEDDVYAQDDIEILDWVENSQWKRVTVHLPVPMCNLQLTTSNDHLFIIGYVTTNSCPSKQVYKLPIALITNSADQLQCANTRWVELAQTTHWGSSLVTGLSPVTVVGGCDTTGTTADIKMYDGTTEKWKKIDSLSFARSRAAVAAISNNAIIVIGGYTKEGGFSDRKSSSSIVVELGQVARN